MPSDFEIEVFYDGGCPICRWEVDLYTRCDKANKIQWVDIERLTEADLPPDKTRDELLGKFHVRGLGEGYSQRWYIGVDAFARIWKALRGFRHFAFMFKLPIIRQVTKLAYLGFLKWQQSHRERRT